MDYDKGSGAPDLAVISILKNGTPLQVWYPSFLAVTHPPHPAFLLFYLGEELKKQDSAFERLYGTLTSGSHDTHSTNLAHACTHTDTHTVLYCYLCGDQRIDSHPKSYFPSLLNIILTLTLSLTLTPNPKTIPNPNS